MCAPSQYYNNSENPRLYQCPVKIYEYISSTLEIQSGVDVAIWYIIKLNKEGKWLF